MAETNTGSIDNALLELTTTVVRKKLTIDGQLYELRNRDEFSLGATSRLRAYGAAIDKINSPESILSMERGEADAISATLTDAVEELIIGGTRELAEKLNDLQKVQVLRHFLGWAPTVQAPAPTKTKPKKTRKR